jgi:hypothetical protein
MRRLLAVVAAISLVPPTGTAQSRKSFPNEDEIRIVLTEAERAIQRYELLIDQEEVQLGDSGAEAASDDRQVLKALQSAVNAFRSNPDGFNGPLGFSFFQTLNEASRSAALCSSTASAQVAAQLNDGDTDAARSLRELAQGCTDVSGYIYTVSENAGTLYERYLSAEAQISKECTGKLNKRAAIGKQNRLGPDE